MQALDLSVEQDMLTTPNVWPGRYRYWNYWSDVAV